MLEGLILDMVGHVKRLALIVEGHKKNLVDLIEQVKQLATHVDHLYQRLEMLEADNADLRARLAAITPQEGPDHG